MISDFMNEKPSPESRTNNSGRWAVILCGGMGTRLGPLTALTPKPLIEVNAKPIIAYIFEILIKHQYTHIILPVGWMGDKITNYIQSYPFPNGLECLAIDTGTQASIGSRLAQIANIIPDGEDFLLANGDQIFDFNLRLFYEHHISSGNLLTFATTKVNSTFGLLHYSNGRITDFTRNEFISSFNIDDNDAIGLIYSGICLMNKSVIESQNIAQCLSFEEEVYPTLIKTDQTGYYMIDGFWYPIDTPKDLDRIETIMHGKRILNE